MDYSYTIHTLTLEHADYPNWLAQSSQNQCTLYVQGTLPPADFRPLAMVGTRTPSWNGIALAQSLVSAVRHHKTSIISGLAHGIDSKCHEAALKNDLHTVAVIAQGLDVPISGPRGVLLRKILAAGGAVVSPFPPGTPALKHNFLIRNRIIAALACATVVIESREMGGSMHTAAHCLEEGRLLLATPGDILRNTAQGPNLLVESQSALPLWLISNLPIFAELESCSSGISAAPLQNAQQLDLWNNFAGESLSIEEIVQRSKQNLPNLLAILSELELQGYVELTPQKHYNFHKTPS